MSWEPERSGVGECGRDAAAYVLGALTSGESDVFRAHLESCAICQDEVDSFGQVEGVLGMAASQQQPSTALRRRVMREVRADAQMRKARSRRVPGSAFRRPAFLGAMAAMLAAAVIAGVQIASPGTSTRVFHATVGDAQVRLVGRGYAELTVHRLPRLKSNRIYEVWLRRSDGVLDPRGLFSVTASGDGAVDVSGSLKGVRAVLVTEEPAGGTKVPTTKPVIVMPVT